MHAGLPGGVGAALGPRILLGTGLLAAAALFGGNGSAYAPLVWIGSIAIVAAGAGLALAFWGVAPLPRLSAAGLAFTALLVALVVWMGFSVLWSVEPDRSWEYMNRGVVYVAFLVIGLLVGAFRAPLRWVAAGAGVLSLAVVLWALAGKVIPDLFPDGERVARLRDPLGYWNALAVVAAFAVLFGLWAASRREHAWQIRSAAAASVFVSTVALLLTFSRGGALVAAIVAATLILVVRERVQLLATLAVAIPPALAVSIWAFSADGISADGQPYDTRLRAGLVLGVLLVGGAALVVVAARYLLRYEERYAQRIWLPSARETTIGAAAVAAVVIVVLVAGGWTGRALDEFTNPAPESENVGPGRVVSFSSNSRWDWWQESWQIFEHDPIGGSGAGTFLVARRPYRENLIFVIEPHSVPIQFLAETGIVGFLLFVGLVATGIGATVQSVRRLDAGERTAATALALAALAYLLHAFVDYDWDFVALTGPVLLLLGLLLGRAPGLPPVRRPLLAAGAVLFAVASIASVAAPWLATRNVDEAYELIIEGDADAAAEAADDARQLNPLAIEPLLAAAAVEEERGNDQRALELYVEAVELQPENPQTWYELASFERSVGLREEAIRHVGRAQALDPKSQEVVRLIQELFDLPTP
jgi:O-Antigen ligase